MRQIFVVGVGILLLGVSGIYNIILANSKPVDLILQVHVDPPPPCSVTGGSVDFQTVNINDINGSNYRKDAGYTLSCPDRKADDLRMQLRGSTTTINGEKVVDVGVPGFGIRIENADNNSLFSIGENNWTPFNITSQPKLNAVPVKQSGAQLSGADFSGSLTMVVDYQ
ncbi:fimbrial protein [Escherichia coli]|uniref:fimbrial protein n=1 Tax=Escherichia coli TaxID=562 RepID=UPI000DA51673|nr:fimbrial protein [Escherichia coli]SQL06910.1 putative fimbrial-like adhesin protein [Escherichia coli]HBJ1114246.1 fimbrial protein [Escherichia coli]